MNKEVLKVSHLQKKYINRKKEFTAVKDISFEINSGQVLALIGPNGAGKTTTVSMIGGYLMPTSGTVLINNQNIWENKKFNNSEIGVVFGGELGFYGRATAYDNLKFFSNLNKIPFKKQKKEIIRVLELVELEKVANKKVEEFSRGMRQRLHIARALLGKPKILLLDEPTNGLDIEIATEIRKVLLNLVKDTQVAILLTSHIMSEIETLADKIILIGNGEIKKSGTLQEIISMSKVHHINRPATLEESYLALASELRRQ